MTPKDRQILDQFAARVREVAPEAKIWAFGSRARGTATDESDMDVCVVVERFTEELDDLILGIACEVGIQYDLVITPIPYSLSEFEQGPLSVSPLVRVIKQEGVAA